MISARLPDPIYYRLLRLQGWWQRVWCVARQHKLTARKEELFWMTFYAIRCGKCGILHRVEEEQDFLKLNCRGFYLT